MIYEVVDNGQVIFKGKQADICKKFFADKTVVSKCARTGNKLFQQYEIRRRYYKPSALQIEKSKKVPVIDYLEKHLRIYGNTCLNHDPTPYIDELKNRGIEVTFRKVKSDNGICKRKTYFYIIEKTQGG